MTGTIMICGSGPAGLDIASAFSRAGVASTLFEPDQHAADRARFFLGKRPASGAAIEVTSDVTLAEAADFVFEALDEPDQTRVTVLTNLARHLPDHATVALTSLVDLSALPFPEALKSRLLGFQLAAPAHLRHLIEIAVLRDTPPNAKKQAFDLARMIGKTPVSAPADRASIGTRLQRRLNTTADTLLMDGANPFELDDAMVAFGFDMGVYAAQDLIGLDVAYSDRKRLAPDRDPAQRYIPISDRMVEEGRLGQKVGVGWYRYPGGGGAVIDPLVEDLIREEARFAGVTTRPFSVADMQNHVVLALVQEAAAMLEDQTAACAADIDLVSVAGLGFPAQTGGLISWADAKGAPYIHAALVKLAAQDPQFAPGPALSDCARLGIPLADWTS